MAARALGAVEPSAAVLRAVRSEANVLSVAGSSLDLRSFRRAVVLGLGKAAVPMGRAALRLLDGLEVTGTLVTSAPEPVGPLEVVPGEHPVPGDRSLTAGRRLLDTAAGAGESDLALVLISGGGSALAEVPADGVALEDLREVVGLLLRSGASIGELNAVRKHLSALKGGRLAEALDGAGAIVTLVLSDVVGSPLDVIASGPTVPDPTTFVDALAVLDGRALTDRVPAAALRRLRAGAAGRVPETPGSGPVFDRQLLAVVADAATAARAAVVAGRAEGWDARLVTAELEGEARDAGRRIAALAAGADRGALLVHAGETTVTVTGQGTGGRNQELALAASIELAGRDDVVLLSLGTDGIDGPTDAAGAFADGSAVARARGLGLDAADHLRRNDSHALLAAIGDVVTCGPTGTNVGDLILALHA